MRSRRSRAELACRVAAFAMLGWLLGLSLMPPPERRLERATASQVGARLPAWTRAAPGVALHGDFTVVPSAWEIDWLAALRRSGHVVTWSGAPPALVVAAEALTDPRGGARVEVAAPEGAAVALRDDASAIDSLHVERLGGSVRAPVVIGRVVATSGGQSASVPAPNPVRLRSIVVTGIAGWEGKFIVAALEERGWPVIARFDVAPRVRVAPARPLVLDTSRIAAVIAVDTSIRSLGPALARYVRSGGGLVLAGSAGLAPGMSDLVPGTLGPRVRQVVRSGESVALGSTGYFPVRALRPGGIALERRSAGTAIAARRVGSGRVLQVGYDDTWRWRMAGAEGSENAHREWWAQIVGAVAYAPEGAGVAAAGDVLAAAPLASLVDRLGPAHDAPRVPARRASLDPRLLLVLMMILLLAEWASRRLRGLR